MDLELAGKVAFVAGSTRGIGLAIARGFLREGASVIITGRDESALEEARSALSAESGAEHILAVHADLSERPEIERALEASVAAFDGLDAVVANIGSGVSRSGWELSAEDWQSSLTQNLVSSLQIASAALPRIISRGGGTLTFISSIAGWEVINAPLTYSAAKAALLNAMKGLSRQVGAHAVRVNAVVPGNILFPGGTWEQKLAERREFFEKYIQAEVPLNRFGTAEEIADAVVFLASARASFITGACIVADGGQTRSI